MSDATALEFGTTTAPMDESPAIAEPITGHVPFDPDYPDSTPEAPFGFKPDGTPYKRHHGKRSGTGGGSRNLPATDKQAATAAALLARLNALFGITLTVAGMPQAAASLAENNETFEVMAREALLTDPALCRKILSAGATSGKAGLIMAYVMLGASTYPAMRDEYRENHPKEVEE